MTFLYLGLTKTNELKHILFNLQVWTKNYDIITECLNLVTFNRGFNMLTAELAIKMIEDYAKQSI
jgi:hypothetical protein